MHFWELLLDAMVLLSAALVLGALMELVRQSAIVGFILAGALVGPGGLALVSGESDVDAIAELGVALLLFSIGLEFSAARLRAMGLSVLALGAGQVVATLLVAAAAGRLLGLATEAAVALGAMVSLSSTAVVLRVLIERAEMDSVHGRAALGILLVQDAAVVPLVLLVSAIAPSAAPAPDADPVALLPRVAGGIAALVGLVAFTRLALPRLLAGESPLARNRELQILFAVAVAIGGAWLSHALGLSPSLGAFVAGAVLGDSAVSLQVRADVAPLRTLFVTLFFGSIGMLGDPAWIARHPVEVLLAVAALVVGKAAVVWPLARLSGLSHGHAVATGMCVAQSGEFSFVLAQAAQGGAAPLLDADGFALLVSATIGGLLLTPYLVAQGPRVGAAVERLAGRGGAGRAPVAEHLEGHVIVIGYGPAGRAVAETVAGAGGQVVVVDLSPRSVAEARRVGHAAHLGDASALEVLEEAHVSTARAVVVAIPDHRGALHVIARSRTLAPGADLVVRARYAIHAGALAAAGAAVVVDEEVEVGHRLAEAVRSLMSPQAGEKA